MQDFLFFLKFGWEHIISTDALDHQLFVLALVLPYTIYDFRKLLVLITAFTIGHSVTLALSVFDMLRMPPALVETLIPVTIAITAIENLVLKKNNSRQLRLAYVTALLFGLIHGMGFANTARMMIASEQEIAVPLLGFNMGLELGQILIVLIVITANFIVTDFLKLRKIYWQAIVSVAVLALALVMAIERFSENLA